MRWVSGLVLVAAVGAIRNPFRRRQGVRSDGDSSDDGDPSRDRYAVVLDAGSSGTRVNIFHWLETPSMKTAVDDGSLSPEQYVSQVRKTLKQLGYQKTSPGVSSFAARAEEQPGEPGAKEEDGRQASDKGADSMELRHSLEPLLDFAREQVPQKQQNCTPVLFYATAGMRTVSALASSRIMKWVLEILDSSPFLASPDAVSAISGEREVSLALVALPLCACPGLLTFPRTLPRRSSTGSR